jgi:hypothetical protein
MLKLFEIDQTRPFPGLNERRPVERMAPVLAPAQYAQLHLPEPLIPPRSLLERLVIGDHQILGRFVRDGPEAHDLALGSSQDQRAAQSLHAFAVVSLRSTVNVSFQAGFLQPSSESARIRIAPIVLVFDHRSLREPGMLEAMRAQALSIVSVFLREGLHLRALLGHWSDSSMALYSVANCIGGRNTFTLFAKIFWKMCGRRASMLKAAGKCNPADHLLSQRTERVFGDRDIAPLRSESFKS